MTHTIVDNFLSEEDFSHVRKVLLGSDFPWFLKKGIVNPDDSQSYFVHEFYCEHNFCSNWAPCLDPIFRKLNIASILRCKINLYPQADKVVEHGYHQDFDYKHKGFLFYLNTCDGYTKLQDGTVCESVANRAMLFDSSLPHTSTGCTDQPYRMTINLNYLERESV